jgi:hypothetical protein
MEKQIWPLIKPKDKEDDLLREKASAKKQVMINS